MSFAYTPGQRLAIESRGGAVLVSAAAGSGKTRVLTQRLLEAVTDPAHPVDVDRFLVITYTRAAAAELRTRILDALASEAAAHPGDSRLRRQQNLCCRAPICTIHSLCTAILREYAQLLELSPAFTVLDEDRAEQLKRAAVSRLLEERYAHIQDDATFRLLVDTVGAGRDDRRLETTLLDLYDRLRSQPEPRAWVRAQKAALYAEGCTDVGQTLWGQVLLADARSRAAYWAGAMEACVAEIYAGDARLQKAYGEVFAATAEGLRALCRATETGWDDARAACPVPFPRLGVLRGYDDPETAERLKAVRAACKDACGGLAQVFAQDSAALLRDLRAAAPAMEALLDLVLELERVCDGDKRRRGVVDFADLEQYTARLLTDPDSGAPTWVAVELSQRYEEILVDEYQDVNPVQERIFQALSRQGKNLFLVGDVKQSIYRFRLADPGLFLEKYGSFPPAEQAAEGQPRRVLLQENFRSRRPILEAANRVFSALMSRELGELDYDDDAALRYGASGYDPALDTPVELHIVDGGAAGDGEETPESAALEARFVADKILELMRAGTPVTENGVTRPCRWSDFVLLLRSPGGKGKTFHRVLSEAGIPVDSQQGGGFFTSLEVAVTIDLLSVIDNPHADVPLISALRSPAFGFTADELSAIRTADRRSDFYGAVRASAAAGDGKSAAFLRQLETWRALAPELSPEALVWRIYGDTGLLGICAAMGDGPARRQNLMHLFEYARSFGQGGYRGLFRFVQWLRRLAEKGQEPESGAAGEAVRILSIHRSKGLEFPFVFLCDLAHRFNRSDLSVPVPMHPRLGLGPKAVDAGRGLEYPTVARRAVTLQLGRELLSEELRVLYVGLTRARERLYLSCAWKKPREALDKLALSLPAPLPPELLRGASDPSRWLAMAALQNPEALPIRVHDTPAAAVTEAETPAAEPAEAPAVAQALAALREKLDFVYPWAQAVDLPSKLTATELKSGGEAEDEAAALLPAAETELTFRRAEPGKVRALSAAERGTAMHSFLQYVDLGRTDSREALAAEAERLAAAGYLRPEELASLDLTAAAAFFASPTGRRLRAATEVRREFRFLLLADAADYFPTAAGTDQLLLQGVVDCCFVENGGVTVLDYKTDRITPAQVPERAARYRGQLSAYAAALERILDLPVRHCILWFLHCGVEYEVAPEQP